MKPLTDPKALPLTCTTARLAALLGVDRRRIGGALLCYQAPGERYHGQVADEAELAREEATVAYYAPENVGASIYQTEELCARGRVYHGALAAKLRAKIAAGTSREWREVGRYVRVKGENWHWSGFKAPQAGGKVWLPTKATHVME